MQRTIRNVGRKRDETDAHNPQCDPLGILSLPPLKIAVQPPEQSGSTDNFDYAVEAEADQGNTSRHEAGDQSRYSFNAVPRYREVLQPLSAPGQNAAINSGGDVHDSILAF
jgi:hypothetical protein